MPAPGPAIAAARLPNRAALLGALIDAAGNQTRAARSLGLSLATFKRRLVAAGLDTAALREIWPLSGRQPAGAKKSTAP